jgi:hypothetical protein
MRIVHIVTAAAVALSAPVLVDGSNIPALDEFGVAYAGKGNGNGNSGGKGGGNAGSGGGKSDKASGRTSGSKGKGASGQKGQKTSAKGSGKLKTKFKNTLKNLGLTKQKVRIAKVVRKSPAKGVKSPQKVQKVSANREKKPVAAPREKNLHAQLKGLNSLNRDANGFFNGNDPKLDPLREFVASSVTYSGLENALVVAQADLAENQALLDELATELGLTSNDPAEQRIELENLQEDLLADEPALDDPTRSEWETELAAVESGLDVVDEVNADADAVASAETALEDAENDVSEDALRDAIATSMTSTGSGTVAAEDLSDEVVGFVSDKLGFGDAEGFIDVAIEEAESEDELVEDSEVSVEVDPIEGDTGVVEAL